MYRFDEMRQIRDKDNQNQISLILNEICQLNEIMDAESQYTSDDDAFNLPHNHNEFTGLKTFANIRWGCVFKLSQSYKNNASKSFKNRSKYSE